MKQVRCSPKSAILQIAIGNFENPLPIESWHHFFLLGMAVACLKNNNKDLTLKGVLADKVHLIWQWAFTC